MDINAAFPSQYLKAADLQGREVTVVMSRVVMEKVGQDQKPVLYFQGKERGVALNKTNSMTIASAYGTNTDGWGGHQVVLFPAWVDYQGKQVQAIRIRPAFSGAAQAPQQPMMGGQPAYVGAGNAGPLPPPTQPAPQQRGGHLDDDIPFAAEWRV